MGGGCWAWDNLSTPGAITPSCGAWLARSGHDSARADSPPFHHLSGTAWRSIPSPVLASAPPPSHSRTLRQQPSASPELPTTAARRYEAKHIRRDARVRQHPSRLGTDEHPSFGRGAEHPVQGKALGTKRCFEHQRCDPHIHLALPAETHRQLLVCAFVLRFSPCSARASSLSAASRRQRPSPPGGSSTAGRASDAHLQNSCCQGNICFRHAASLTSRRRAPLLFLSLAKNWQGGRGRGLEGCWGREEV